MPARNVIRRTAHASVALRLLPVPMLLAAVLAPAVPLRLQAAEPAGRPNILWLSAEDLSAGTLGCYGGRARTPRIDALARSGLRFDAAFSAAPVCAPSRSAIITGMMPTTLGSLPMRCRAKTPPHVQGFPIRLREAGYHCTNNAKTDYNLADPFAAGWHESGPKAHWRNRADRSQPFFAVFNLDVTHESGLFGGKPEKVQRGTPPEARRKAADVCVPPYYPDTPVIRTALAQRLELAAALDADVGHILDELAADGLAADTIVVFWGDHGEGIPHGKRSLTEHGLRVPLLVHVPSRFMTATLPAGRPARGSTDTLVSLMDLGPTMLDLAGIPLPEWMEGTTFLGPHAVTREHVIGARDRMDSAPGSGRTVRDARFRYVRNFLPWIGGDDLPPFADGVAITGELRRLRAVGGLPPGAAWFARTSRPAEELFDIGVDPDQIHDLAATPSHAAELLRLRESLRTWMRETRDTGILPEPILRREAREAGSEWAIFHPPTDAAQAAAAARYDAILTAAWDVAEGHPIAYHAARLMGKDPAVRFWAASGTGWAGVRDPADGQARAAAAAALEPVCADPDAAVRIAAARWSVACGPSAAVGLDLLAREMRSDDAELRFAALAAIEGLGDSARPLWKAVAELEPGKDEEYSRRIVAAIRERQRAATR